MTSSNNKPPLLQRNSYFDNAKNFDSDEKDQKEEQIQAKQLLNNFTNAALTTPQSAQKQRKQNDFQIKNYAKKCGSSLISMDQNNMRSLSQTVKAYTDNQQEQHLQNVQIPTIKTCKNQSNLWSTQTNFKNKLPIQISYQTHTDFRKNSVQEDEKQIQNINAGSQKNKNMNVSQKVMKYIEELENKKKQARDREQSEQKRKNDILVNARQEVQKRNYELIQLKKKRYKLLPETKIFIVVGSYHTLRQALIERGWHENTDKSSTIFDLKFAIKMTDVCTQDLQDFQLVNHFFKNNLITTKTGLCHSLKNLVWWNNVEIDAFFPKCFDLTDDMEIEDFKNEYRFIKAESILKTYVAQQSVNQIEKLLLSIKICERRLKDIDDQLDDKTSVLIVSDIEWEYLQKEILTPEQQISLRSEKWFQLIENQFSDEFLQYQKNEDTQTSNLSQSTLEVQKRQFYLTYCTNILQRFQDKFPQNNINGRFNTWIVKPGGKSRGRGIKVFRSYDKIMQYVKAVKGRSFIVQKYIENPLIVMKKKFDIRQWVLVTDWNPLTVWIYKECYIRFSPIDYDITKLNDKFMHLTNNAIVSKSEKFYESEIEGNMWSCEQFSSHLQETYQKDVFQDEIWPQIQKYVTCSLQSVQDMVENRKNSFEFLGYDFMVDEDLKVWLIEVNSSPSMDLSTNVTERLVKLVLTDLPKVILDYPKAKKKKECDTGGFILCHKAKIQVDRPKDAMNLNLLSLQQVIKPAAKIEEDEDLDEFRQDDWGKEFKSGFQELEDDKYWMKQWDKTEATDEDVQLVREAIQRAKDSKSGQVQ
eukprot:403361837